MPVETVEFVERHEVEQFFHFLYAEKVAGHVEHESAVAEARLIGNVQAGQSVASGRSGGCLTQHDVGRKQLLEGLEGIEESGSCAGFNVNAFGSDLQFVALCS